MGHLGASGPAMLCRVTERDRRPGSKDGNRVRLEGTHARVPGHVIGLGCVGAGIHAARAFSCVQHSSDYRTMIREVRQMIFADRLGRLADPRNVTGNQPAAAGGAAVAAARSSSAAWTCGGPAKMLPDRSQPRSSPFQSVTTPPASRTITPPAATSQGPSWSSK